jgi:hypothetical protein
VSDINTPQPVWNIPGDTIVEHWQTGPPMFDYRIPEYNIKEIHGDFQFIIRPDAWFKRTRIPNYYTIRQAIEAQFGGSDRTNLHTQARINSEIYRVALREELDEIIRHIIIQNHPNTSIDVSNKRLWYARIVFRELANRADQYGLEVSDGEFRSVRLVSEEIEEQCRQSIVAAYSKSQELRMMGEAWSGLIESSVQRMVQSLQRLDIPVSAQRLDTVARDAMREAFFHRYGSHAYHFSRFLQQPHPPDDGNEGIGGDTTPFLRAS